MTDGAERLSVLWVIKTLGYGGAETILRQLAPHMDPQVFKIDCAFSDSRFEELIPDLEVAGVTVIRLSKGCRPYGWIPRLIRLIWRGDYSVVHSHSPLLAAVARFAVWTRRGHPRTRHVTTEHNLRYTYHPLTRLVTALTSRIDDRCLAVSEGVNRSIHGSVRRRTVTTYQGVDIASLEASANARYEPAGPHRRLLSVANLRPQKDFPTLFTACSLLSANGIDYRLDIVGDSIPRVGREVRELPAQFGVDERVAFLGPRSDVPNLMRASEVLIISSTYEAGPVVALEAAALGLPIVSTRVGLLNELFTSEHDCLLVDVGDAEDISRSVIRVLTDVELRDRIVGNARDLVERLRIDQVANELGRLYRQLSRVSA